MRLFVLFLLAGCHHESCLGGEADCRVSSPCQALKYSCSGGILELTTLSGRAPLAGPETLGARGDVLLGNEHVTAVIAGLGNSNYLDAAGGALLDLAPRGGSDGIAEVVQAVGILPEDSPDYTSLTLIDERPHRVAVQLRGTLLHKPDIAIYTLYEVRPCEPGIRVRTEVYNGTAEPQLWALSDGLYWSAFALLPFTPGMGFDYLSFGLTDIDDAYRTAPFVSASTHAGAPVSYAQVGCNIDQMEGFQSATVSASGLPRTVIESRSYAAFERFLLVTAGGDVAASTDLALDVRRRLHGEKFLTLRGTISRRVHGERDVALVISDPRGPLTQVVPASDGSFSARVPLRDEYDLEVRLAGRQVKLLNLGPIEGDRDLGTIEVLDLPGASVTVKDELGQPLDAIVYVVPADDSTRNGSEGTLYGNYGTCAPWLGNPAGESPACNRFLVSAQAGPEEVYARSGKYFFYAFHGPFWTLGRATVTLADGVIPVEISLRALPLLGAGALSADLHVHGAASFDSTLPDYDRVLSFAAANIDVLVATDHDIIHDYRPMIEQLGLKMISINGIETTGHIPFKYVPGDPYPRVVGHFNFWPLTLDPDAPRGGAPADEFFEPGQLFDHLEPIFSGSPIMQLNHPWLGATFGRDQGFPLALGLNLTHDLPAADDGTPAGVFVRARGMHHNNDHHLQEVMNGTKNDLLLPYRVFWFYMLNQGQLRTGTANSDSHNLTDNTIGTPRNVVYADGPDFDLERFDQALRDGHSFGTNGPIIEATLDGNGFSVHPLQPTANQLSIQVSAAPWIPVDEIRIVINGKVAKTITNLPQPADPFGTDGLLRYSSTIDLTPLLPSGDAWVVVEAGDALPLAADLDGDGMVDTTDNNGDGKVDSADVARGQTSGPLNNPPAVTDQSDRHFHFNQVVTRGYPFAFTNPFVLDRDGNGRFDAPGVAR
jgi:hypothetical protein